MEPRMESPMCKNVAFPTASRRVGHRVCILVEDRYVPDTITVPAGEPVKLLFRRRDRTPCSETVVFPDQGLRWTLTRRHDVAVDLPPCEPGEYPFHCGMEMMRGRLVVR